MASLQNKDNRFKKKINSLSYKERNSDVILFITMGNYDDDINNHIIEWEGQSNNKLDYLILDNDKSIYIFYRKKNLSEYFYLSKVKYKKIITQRTETQKLKVKFTMEKISWPLDSNPMIEIYDYENEGGHSAQKYKMNCFNKLNLIPKGNWQSGIMEGIQSYV